MRPIVQFALRASWLVGVLLVSTGATGDLSPAEALKLIPITRSAYANHQQIGIQGRFTTVNWELKYLAVYRAPENYTLLLADANNLVPIIFSHNNHLMIFDTLDSTILLISPSRFSLRIGPSPDGICSFNFELDDERKKSVIELNVRDCLDPNPSRLILKRNAPNNLELCQRLNDDNYLRFNLDPTSKFPLKQFAYTTDEAHRNGIFVEKIQLDEACKLELPRFPKKEDFGGKLKVLDLTQSKVPQGVTCSTLAERAFFGRLGLKEKEARREVEERLGVKPNWSRIEQEDAETARAIHAAIKLDAVFGTR